MRETEASGGIVQNSSSVLTRALRLAVIGLRVGVLCGGILGIGVVATAGTARAADDDEEKSFTDKIVDSFKTSIRGTSIDDGKIEYRERSPLVVPPRLDLPPPETSSKEVKAPNWPKDPDEGRRKVTAAAKKKGTTASSSGGSGFDPFNPLKRDIGSAGNSGGTVPSTTADIARPAGTPSPAGAASAAGQASTAEAAPPSGPARPDDPAAKTDPAYDQSGDLFKTNVIGSAVGFNGFGGFSFGNLFGSKTEAATFKAEPTRETLTQPPAGYQTPSPNFAYGTEEKDWLTRELNRPQNPDKVDNRSQQKP